MRKQLAVAFGLAVVASPAFATKARLEALGEDSLGSYYINDNRNYFLNPARINNHKDLVTFEFGASGDNNGVSSDTANAPKAEGGFTKGHGNLVYGLHFGSTSPSVGLMRTLGGQAEVQPWDIFIGGDAGMKWGANLTYENYSSGAPGSAGRNRSDSVRVRGGVMMGDIEAFAHVSLANKAKNGTTGELEGDLGFLVGASTMIQNYRVFADYTRIAGEYKNTTLGSLNKEDIKVDRLKIGAGRVERLNDRATLFAKAQIERQVVEDDNTGYGAILAGNNNGGAGEYTSYVLPLNVGLEYAATSWLDLRASVSQNLWSQLEVDPKAGSKYDRKIANTAVRAGASLKFGEFAIDGLISTDSDGDGAIPAPGRDGTSTDGGNGTLRTDNLMTRVSMIYRF